MITVLDYDAGNIKSVEKALDFLGEEVKITRDREEILSADGVIRRVWERSVMPWKNCTSTDWWMSFMK